MYFTAVSVKIYVTESLEIENSLRFLTLLCFGLQAELFSNHNPGIEPGTSVLHLC